MYQTKNIKSANAKNVSQYHFSKVTMVDVDTLIEYYDEQKEYRHVLVREHLLKMGIKK